MRKVKMKLWNPTQRKMEDVEGDFHQWGVNYEEFQSGPGNYTVGIVELPDGKVVMPMADTVQFLDKVNPTVVFVEPVNWYCGCGHVNGPNLSLCAQCGRKPGSLL